MQLEMLPKYWTNRKADKTVQAGYDIMIFEAEKASEFSLLERQRKWIYFSINGWVTDSRTMISADQSVSRVSIVWLSSMLTQSLFLLSSLCSIHDKKSRWEDTFPQCSPGWNLPLFLPLWAASAYSILNMHQNTTSLCADELNDSMYLSVNSANILCVWM